MSRPARLGGMVQRSHAVLLVALLALAGCTVFPGSDGSAGSGSPSASTEGGVSLRGQVVAGPTCPVVTEPPQSGCTDRPVSGAVLLIQDAAGRQAGRLTSGADGSFGIQLAPGRYRIVPQSVRGLMGTAPDQEVTLGESLLEVTVHYDTGIR
jgi:hypothetical protein